MELFQLIIIIPRGLRSQQLSFVFPYLFFANKGFSPPKKPKNRHKKLQISLNSLKTATSRRSKRKYAKKLPILLELHTILTMHKASVYKLNTPKSFKRERMSLIVYALRRKKKQVNEVQRALNLVKKRLVVVAIKSVK